MSAGKAKASAVFARIEPAGNPPDTPGTFTTMLSPGVKGGGPPGGRYARPWVVVVRSSTPATPPMVVVTLGPASRYVTPKRLFPSFRSTSAQVSVVKSALGTAARLPAKKSPSALAKWAPAAFFCAPTVTKPHVPWVLMPSSALSQAAINAVAATGISQVHREGERSWRIIGR